MSCFPIFALANKIVHGKLRHRHDVIILLFVVELYIFVTSY